MKKSSVAEKTAIQLLKEDHKKVKEIFDEFEDTDEQSEKDQLIQKACDELKIHSKIEEEIFYPAVKAEIEEDNLMAEAREEHHVVAQLIDELQAGNLDDVTTDAKFTVLAENVRHHIKEEEGEMFPKVQKSDLDLEDLGRRLQERKEELEEELA